MKIKEYFEDKKIDRIINIKKEEQYKKIKTKIEDKYFNKKTIEEIETELKRVKICIKAYQSPYISVVIALFLACITILVGELIEADLYLGGVYILAVYFVIGRKFLGLYEKFQLYCICEEVLVEKLNLLKVKETDGIKDIKRFLGI